MAEAIDLTPSQQALAIHLLRTQATEPTKVMRRRDLGNDNFELYSVDRDVYHVEFMVHPEEFALTGHRNDIRQPLSEVYLNLRNMSAETLNMVGQGVTDAIPQDMIDTIGVGIPDAGTAIGHAVRMVTGISMINLFAKAPLESKQRLLPDPHMLDGAGQRIILFDDLITQATTKLDAIEVAEQLGWTVVGVAVLVDREQGGREQLEERGYKLYAAMKLSDMLNLYLVEGLIDQGRFDKVNTYLASFR